MTNKQKKAKAKNERRLEQKQQRAKEAADKRKKGNKLMEVGGMFLLVQAAGTGVRW